MPGVTSVLTMNATEFDRWLTIAEREARDSARSANDAFVAAMNKAIRRGRAKVKPGTFVDTTPPINAKRFAAEPRVSACGSPAAMCLEVGGAPSGTEAMK